MTFRDRLLATLRAIEPILSVPGVLVAGSEVPNLLEPGAAALLVVSQDVDLAIPIGVHDDVKRRLSRITELVPSPDEPSVWVPRLTSSELIEVNFIGIDANIVDPIDTYEMQDAELPLMVFAALSLLTPGTPLNLEGLLVPVPRPAGLALEKLISDRTGEKGDRDLLVVAGLLQLMTAVDLLEMEAGYRGLAAELRHAIRSNLTVLSLLPARANMPDPAVVRASIADLLRRLVA
ncbi:MAG: hypothetical protein ABI867_32735 [Kofleriaceae bacterium]